MNGSKGVRYWYAYITCSKHFKCGEKVVPTIAAITNIIVIQLNCVGNVDNVWCNYRLKRLKTDQALSVFVFWGPMGRMVFDVNMSHFKYNNSIISSNNNNSNNSSSSNNNKLGLDQIGSVWIVN